MKKRKRAISAAVCIFLCLAIFFLIWVNNDYGRHNLLGRSSLPPQRTIRQLMLPNAEEIYRSEDDIIIYDAGKYMLMLEMGWQNYSLCPFENGAAVLPSLSGIVYEGSAFTEIELPFYALHHHSGAERAELEIYASRTLSPYGSGEHHELHCVLPSESCAENLASFTLRIDCADSHTASLANDLWLCLKNGSVVNAVYDKMNLRFYDAEGKLLSESVFEMGEKES